MLKQHITSGYGAGIYEKFVARMKTLHSNQRTQHDADTRSDDGEHKDSLKIHHILKLRDWD